MEKWINLENEIGFNEARIVAYAVSWCFRPDNWRFLAWYWKLKPDLKSYVDTYFDAYLKLELEERSVNHNTDLSRLCNYFKLPMPIRIVLKEDNPHLPDGGLPKKFRKRKRK